MSEQKPSQTEPPVPPKEPEAPKPAPPVEKQKPDKRPSFLMRALRWLLVVLVLFGLGTVLVIFTLYIPTRNDLTNARRSIDQISEQSEAESERAEAASKQAEAVLQEAEAALEEAKQEIAGLDERSQALQEELDQANLRIGLLQVRTDVLTARLALVDGDKEKALLALSTTSETLDELAGQLPDEQSDFIKTMQKRLDLSLEGIENEDSAADSDLNVLIIKLLELEDSLTP